MVCRVYKPSVVDYDSLKGVPSVFLKIGDFVIDTEEEREGFLFNNAKDQDEQSLHGGAAQSDPAPDGREEGVGR